MGARTQVIVPASVITDPRMTQSALAVYVLMQWHTQDDGTFHATREGLAGRLGVTGRTVIRAWDLLQAQGHLALTRRAIGKGQGRIEKADFPSLVKGDTDGPTKGGSLCEFKGDTDAAAKGDTPDDPRGDIEAALERETKGDRPDQPKGDTAAAFERENKGDTDVAAKGDSPDGSKGDTGAAVGCSQVPLRAAPPYNPPVRYLSEETRTNPCTVQNEAFKGDTHGECKGDTQTVFERGIRGDTGAAAKGDRRDLETALRTADPDPSSAFTPFGPHAVSRPRRAKRTVPAHRPSEHAERTLTAWERLAPLPGTCNRNACLRTLDNLARIDHLSWDRINRVCAWAVKEWVPKGFLASPMSLREWTRKKDMRTWEALERQAINQEPQQGRDDARQPRYSTRDLAYQRWYLEQFRLVAPTPYAPQDWKEPL
jgi:hypothetical protein